MNDPQKFIWLPLSAAAFLAAALSCPNANAQSYYQQNQTGGSSDTSVWEHPRPARAQQTAPQTSVRQATNMVPLKPPGDIFKRIKPVAQPSTVRPSTVPPPTAPPTHPVAQTAWNQLDTGVQTPPPSVTAPPNQPQRFTPAGPFDGARRLGNSKKPSTTRQGLFDSINAITESSQPKFARANLELDTTTARTDLDALTSNATEKLGNAKDWIGEKTGAMIGGLKNSGWQDRLSRMFGGADIKKIIGGLAVVIGGYLGLVWLLRMINPGGTGAIPREVLEVVGSAPLNSNQNLQLIRLGSKLMLMIHGPDGSQPIGEVSDPAEVEQLLALCGGRTQRVSPSVSAAIENGL